MPRIVDLTLPVQSGMSGIPKIPFYEQIPVRIEAITLVSDEQRDVLARESVDVRDGAATVGHMNTLITLHTHMGTHIDAPRHFYADGAPVDQLPLERLVMKEAVVFDCGAKAAGEGVTADDLARTGVTVSAGQVAVIKTRWTDRAWGTPEFWANTIYLDPSVGEWTASRGIAAVAMDCFPEKPFWRFTLGPAERGANHKRWLSAGIPMIQLVTRLDQLGPRFRITALPLRLRGMDGAPARVVGIAD
jgi:kynurenine formamidase